MTEAASNESSTTSSTTSGSPSGEPDPRAAESPEVVQPDEVSDGQHIDGHQSEGELRESVTAPAKVMRIGSMVKQLLDEVRQAPLDEASRERLAEIYDRSVDELAGALSPDLQEELRSLALPFDDNTIPSEAELRVAKAQLVGWLEGLFHGIQAALIAQQVAAHQQLEGMRQLPGVQQQGSALRPERPGTYL